MYVDRDSSLPPMTEIAVKKTRPESTSRRRPDAKLLGLSESEGIERAEREPHRSTRCLTDSQ